MERGRLGTVAHTYNPSSGELEAGENLRLALSYVVSLKKTVWDT